MWEPLLRTVPPDWDEIAPFSDEVFETRVEFAAYEPVPLEPQIEHVDDSSPHWTLEKVTYTAGFSPDRMNREK